MSAPCSPKGAESKEFKSQLLKIFRIYDCTMGIPSWQSLWSQSKKVWYLGCVLSQVTSMFGCFRVGWRIIGFDVGNSFITFGLKLCVEKLNVVFLLYLCLGFV